MKSTTNSFVNSSSVSSDARDAVASFLQDLRRDGVDWHSVGDGGEFLKRSEESSFAVHAGPCVRATRIQGSGCLKFAHEHGAPWDEWTCAYAAWNRKFGVFEVRARARVSLGRVYVHRLPPGMDIWTV